MSQKETALEALRQVADKETVKSIKQTLLAYILIRGIRDPGPPRWRRTIAILLGAALTGALTHWHVIVSLLR
jgi:hypothetical protein